jgi:ABC-type uncharacterized transport system substrate-binding protein
MIRNLNPVLSYVENPNLKSEGFAECLSQSRESNQVTINGERSAVKREQQKPRKSIGTRAVALALCAVLGISRVGILWDTDSRSSVSAFRDYEDAGRVLKLPIQSLDVRGPSPDFLAKFSAAAKERINAVVIIRNSLLNRYPKHIADLAIKYRVPSMCEGPYYVQSGCLMSYSANDAESYRRAAIYVDKILKGAKPAELPVEQPTKFELVINLKTAKQIGLTIPPNVLARADRVIR